MYDGLVRCVNLGDCGRMRASLLYQSPSLIIDLCKSQPDKRPPISYVSILTRHVRKCKPLIDGQPVFRVNIPARVSIAPH